jgi:DNA-binding response OmpR family regulator
MHALIIEQDIWIVMMIEDALRDLGYKTFHFADTAEQAIALAHQIVPDLITAAVRLGETSGLDAVDAICAGADLPVVFVTSTAWVVRELRPAAIVVQKPFARAHLEIAVERAKRQG